jgi:hypothetical protein
VFGEMVGTEGVIVTLQPFSTIKKVTSHSNFQSNEPFSKLLRQLLNTKCPGQEKKNNTLCQPSSLLRQRYCDAYDENLMKTHAVATLEEKIYAKNCWFFFCFLTLPKIRILNLMLEHWNVQG